jgi:hypothetical protein
VSRAPLGRPEPWTNEQIAALAEVSATDVARAKRQWRRDAPPRFKDLLDAETHEAT